MKKILLMAAILATLGLSACGESSNGEAPTSQPIELKAGSLSDAYEGDGNLMLPVGYIAEQLGLSITYPDENTAILEGLSRKITLRVGEATALIEQDAAADFSGNFKLAMKTAPEKRNDMIYITDGNLWQYYGVNVIYDQATGAPTYLDIPNPIPFITTGVVVE